MKILVLYGTLSGSTMTVAEIIGSSLRQAGHEADVMAIDAITGDTISPYGALIIGSPSWEDQGKDGQPLPEITAFLSALTPGDLTGKTVALFGLGDISYPHFCGAVDIMGEKLKGLGVPFVTESLKIDRYYSLPDNEQKVKDWAKNVASKLT